jgi:hypothetical protein
MIDLIAYIFDDDVVDVAVVTISRHAVQLAVYLANPLLLFDLLIVFFFFFLFALLLFLLSFFLKPPVAVEEEAVVIVAVDAVDDDIKVVAFVLTTFFLRSDISDIISFNIFSASSFVVAAPLPLPPLVPVLEFFKSDIRLNQYPSPYYRRIS